MNRPSYKELWSDEYKDRDEQLQWIRNAVNGNAKFRNSEPPYSEEEELARKIMQMHARIAELEAENETIISDYEERMDNLVNIGNETGRLLQAEIGYLNAQLGIKNLTTETLQLRIAELEAAQRWIPVSEGLPEIGVRVLFYNNFIKNIHKGWYSGDEWTSDIGIFYNGDKLKRITHWMPLPNPPEVQE